MKTITEEQIEQIRKTIKMRGINTIDLEYEMVDHISTAVEEKMNEGYEFQSAFDEVLASFGHCGFSKLQKEREKKLRKEGRKKMNKHFISFFKLPQLMVTIILTISIYFILIKSSSYFDKLLLGIVVLQLLYVLIFTISFPFIAFMKISAVECR